MVKVQIGDIFTSKAATLVNTVNCIGIMGKGIALEFKKRFPDLFKDYASRCARGEVKPGVPYLYSDLNGTTVVNFPTKDHWKSPSRLVDIITGLDVFAEKYRTWGITSVAFPPLGCGNGGLSWKVVGPIIFQRLSKLDIDVEIYAPYGTPPNELTAAFLSSGKEIALIDSMKGVVAGKIRQGWVAILEVLRLLENQPYAASIGRVTFQKICYTLTEQGIDTGFNFRKGAYGPFAPEIKEAIAIFSNANLTCEQQLGNMIALRTGSEYETYRKNHLLYLESVKKKVDKTVDLFCRIKNTEQAEEVATVFFTVRKLKKGRQKITEQDVFDYILNWKKKWDSPEKRESIAEAIRNLIVMRWIGVEFSADLLAEETV